MFKIGRSQQASRRLYFLFKIAGGPKEAVPKQVGG